jgi:hypothetical protein
MKLPEVDVVRLQPAEAVLKMRFRARVVPVANFAHEENLLAAAVHRERLAHDFLGVAVMVIPTIVEEGDAFIKGRMHDANRFGVISYGADVPSSQGNDGYAHSCPAQDARWHTCFGR